MGGASCLERSAMVKHQYPTDSRRMVHESSVEDLSGGRPISPLKVETAPRIAHRTDEEKRDRMFYTSAVKDLPQLHQTAPDIGQYSNSRVHPIMNTREKIVYDSHVMEDGVWPNHPGGSPGKGVTDDRMHVVFTHHFEDGEQKRNITA